MNMLKDKIIKERTTLRMIFVVVCCLIVSYILSLVTSVWFATMNHYAKLAIDGIGSVIGFSAAATLLWDLFVKRAFVDEILEKAKLSRDIEASGLLQITDSFHHDIDWDHLIKTSSKIDIFFAYGNTWRNAHIDALRQAVNKPGNKIRVILPDPTNEQVVLNLSLRFNYSVTQITERINDAKTFFENMKKTTGVELGIWYYSGTPVFTFYRLDNILVLALYIHRKEKTGVPTFVCKQDGNLGAFIQKELDSLLDPSNNLTKKVL